MSTKSPRWPGASRAWPAGCATKQKIAFIAFPGVSDLEAMQAPLRSLREIWPVNKLKFRYTTSPLDFSGPGLDTLIDEVEAKVLDVDRRKRQIRLSMKALQPEIVEEPKPERVEHFDRPEREERKVRADKRNKGKGKRHEETYEMQEEGPSEPEMTAMQIAWMEALERSKADKQHQSRTNKSVSREQEDILNRTLEKRLPTGG